MTRKEYIKSIGAAAQKVMQETGLLASLTIAQAVLESGDGKSDLATKYNNHFGVKGVGDKGSITLPTTEYIGGKKQKVDADFRVYSSIEACFSDRTALLFNGRKSDGTLRYRHIFGMKDFTQAARSIRAAGYATDPDYSALLISIYEHENLAEWDVNPDTNPVPHWAAVAVEWAKQYNISDCRRLDEVITRAEMITMLYNFEIKRGGA